MQTTKHIFVPDRKLKSGKNLKVSGNHVFSTNTTLFGCLWDKSIRKREKYQNIRLGYLSKSFSVFFYTSAGTVLHYTLQRLLFSSIELEFVFWLFWTSCTSETLFENGYLCVCVCVCMWCFKLGQGFPYLNTNRLSPNLTSVFLSNTFRDAFLILS